MKQTIQEMAMDYMHHNEHNFVAANKKVVMTIFGDKVEAESIWYSDKEDKIYLHVVCPEFEGDLDIDSLSDENEQALRKVFRASLPYRNKERMLQETMVLLAADIYQTIYDDDSCGGWGDACDDIIRYARQFEEELDWQEHDERDYIQELEQFEERILKERGLKD